MPNNPDTTPEPEEFNSELWALDSVFMSLQKGYNGYENDYLVEILGNIDYAEKAIVEAEGKLVVPASDWDSEAGKFSAELIARIKSIVSKHAEQRRVLVRDSQQELTKLPLWGG